jgi:excisionase family DNA binding protein
MSTLKSVDEVSQILGCKKITVYRLIRQGKIPHRRIGALLKFSDSDIQDYIESIKISMEAKNEI